MLEAAAPLSCPLCCHPSAEATQELLGKRFGGVLVADASASYNGVHPKDRQSCLAHINTTVVIMRRVIQGTRSDKGLENHSVLRSLFEMTKRQGNKVHQFFQNLFTLSTAEAHAHLYRHPLEIKSTTPGPSPPEKPP